MIREQRRQRQIEREDQVRRTLTILMILMFIVLFCIGNYYEHHYKREAVVTEINEDNGEVTFTDFCGYDWVATVDNVVLYQKVTLIMSDECTTSYVKDDVITKVKPAKIIFAD